MTLLSFRNASLRLVCLAVALACAQRAAQAERLPALDADLRHTSVSGVSSGGYMAVQFHIAHSATVIGTGVLAAGPYYCAQGSALAAVYNCTKPATWTPLPPTTLLESETSLLESSGQIDPTENLKRARVWLFTGKRDETVRPAVVAALRRYYQEYLAPSAIAYVDGIDAGHAMITADHGANCASTSAPYINDCHFDAAGQLLQHIYGELNPPVASETGQLVAFEQNEFVRDPYSISLASRGYAYIPRACIAGRCRVHVAFHGCRQNADTVGLVFIRQAGYNRWADSNRIIVLYPQTISRYGFGGWPVSFVLNPNACWDWWGYTGPVYHTRDGPQVRAVNAMLERLGQHP